MAAALLPTFPGTAEFVVLELLPSVPELLIVVDGGPPIAVVPVDGVVLTPLPGATGPASALDVLPLTEPGVVVLATAPVLGAPGVVADGPVLPTVDEPSVDDGSVDEPSVDELLVEPHGALTPGLRFCANAAVAHAATAAAMDSCANDFMSFSFED